jgi:outer membrane protein assembly factor BamB
LRKSTILGLLVGLLLVALGWKLLPQFRRPAPVPVPQSALLPPPKPKPITDFTMFRGNPERNLSGIGTVPRRPKLLWRFRTKVKVEGPYEQRGSATVTSHTIWQGLGWTGQPLLQGNRLFWGSSDSYVYCLDPGSGEVIWYYPNHHVIKGSISIFNGHIYHGGRDNKIHCYSLDGNMIWETRTGNDMDSNPVVVDGQGFIGGEDKSIYSFEPDTGKIRWRFAPTEGSVESSPCIAGDTVIAGSGLGKLYCLQRQTGKLLWKFATLGDTDSTPVYSRGRIFVGCATGDYGEKGHFWCLDAATGKAIWHVPTERGFWATAAINPEKGRVYIGCNNGVMYAFDAANGKIVWERKLGNRIWSSAAVTDGCIVVGVRDGRVWCLNEDTGEPIWVFDEGFDIDASPLVAGGKIIIGSQDGWVYAIGEAPEGEEINPHWFADSFPLKLTFDHNPAGIITRESPAPIPETYQDTDSHCTDHLRQPVYGN